jgi:hypothetical protein
VAGHDDIHIRAARQIAHTDPCIVTRACVEQQTIAASAIICRSKSLRTRRSSLGAPTAPADTKTRSSHIQDSHKASLRRKRSTRLDRGRGREFESLHSAPAARVHAEAALERVRGVDCAPSEKSSRPAPMQRVAKTCPALRQRRAGVSRHRHVNTDAPWCRDTGRSGSHLLDRIP